MNFASLLRGDKFTPPAGKARLVVDGSMVNKGGVAKGINADTHGERRRELIVSWIEEYGYAEVPDLADEMNIGPNGVLRHLEILEERDVVLRISPGHQGPGKRNRWVMK